MRTSVTLGRRPTTELVTNQHQWTSTTGSALRVHNKFPFLFIEQGTQFDRGFDLARAVKLLSGIVRRRSPSAQGRVSAHSWHGLAPVVTVRECRGDSDQRLRRQVKFIGDETGSWPAFSLVELTLALGIAAFCLIAVIRSNPDRVWRQTAMPLPGTAAKASSPP